MKKSIKINDGGTREQILQSRPKNDLLDPEDVELCVDVWMTRDDKVKFIQTNTHPHTHIYLVVDINVKKYTVKG